MSEQEIRENATNIMLLLESQMSIFISEVKLLTAQMELAQIDDDPAQEFALRCSRQRKRNELNKFEALKDAIIQNPRCYALIGIHMNMSLEEEIAAQLGENNV